MNQSRTRTTGNTPLLRTVSNPYTKMAAPGWLGSCNTGMKVTLTELVTHLHHKIDCPPNFLVKKKKREIMFFRALQRSGTKRSLKCIPPEKSHHFKKKKPSLG